MGFYPHFGTGQALRRKTLFLSVFLSGLTAVLRLIGVFEATIGPIPLRGMGFASDLAVDLAAGLTAATFTGFLLARVGGPAFALRASEGKRASAGASSLVSTPARRQWTFTNQVLDRFLAFVFTGVSREGALHP